MRIAKRIFKNSVLLVVALDETRIHNDDGHAVVDLERGLVQLAAVAAGSLPGLTC